MGMHKSKVLFRVVIAMFCFISLIASLSAAAHAAESYDKLVYPYSYADYPQAESEIIVEASDLSGTTIGNGASVKAIVNAPSNGLYQLELTYRAATGRSYPVDVVILINGEDQHDNIAGVELPRLWTNESAITEDANGNDIRPRQIEYDIVTKKTLTDTFDGESMLLFALKQGSNEIEIIGREEEAAIYQVALRKPYCAPSYNEYITAYNYASNAAETVRVQAENADYKTASSLAPAIDMSSLYSQPNKGSRMALNIIGDAWTNPGQSMTWIINAPDDGLYKLNIRLRQNKSQGLYASRTLLIDGLVPFAEAHGMRFTYSTDWKIFTLGNDEPYSLYLTKGQHEITLVSVLGDMAASLKEADDTIQDLKQLSLDIMKVTGASPDTMRDYSLEKYVPNLVGRLNANASALEALAASLKQRSGFGGGDLAAIEKMARQSREFALKPYQITERFASFQSNISSLAAWIDNSSRVALQLDWLEIAPPDSKPEPAEPGFFQRLGYSLTRFAASFVNDYSFFASEEGQNKNVNIWIATGRDQAQLINQMARTGFTPSSGVSVDIRLITEDMILPAVASGVGPDVWLNAPPDAPVNFASRNSAYDLSTFVDADAIKARFMPSAYGAFEYGGGLYALPESQSCPLMFYRDDILTELGVTPPQTWDELIRVIPTLAQNGMQVLIDGESATMAMFASFLYQNGGEFYTGEGLASALDTEVALGSFLQFTKFYTNYGLPISYNIFNRFKSGESPIVVADMSLYNTLRHAAPEIKGKWKMSPIPGTLTTDGVINRSTASGGRASIMLQNAVDPESAWEFMKWYSDADTQVDYVNGLESLMGASARFNPSNLEAQNRALWTRSEQAVIKEALNWSRAVPEVPGGYYTSRYVVNAFRLVVVSGENYRETMLDYVKEINLEIERKRQELEL